MYGTIFTMNVKTGHEDQLLEIFNSREDKPSGGIAWFLMNPDIERDWIGVAVFESKEAHLANSNNPYQHEMFLKIMEHLDSEPTWVDGEYISYWTEGYQSK
ncbi:MAG: hypothetical protein FI687_04190 [SAR202 cluster bacterium]|nr:hypothetical protein [SAR202 cluster bacterium]|tara:strand:+ start:288 stop:590 length:303 start_codon:yes stop_codon:yes gene_type:complete